MQKRTRLRDSVNRRSDASVPGAPAALLSRLRSESPGFPPTARRIADYVIEQTDSVIHMSITELAERTGASEGSVIGMCRRLGVSGFQELKILLARDLVEPMQLIQEDLAAGDDFTQVSDRIFAAHAASMAETRRLLSIAALSAAVASVRAARRIDVFGIGSAAPVAMDLAYRLQQLGLEANALVDSHVQAVRAAMGGVDVTTITVSHSGSTMETVLATRLAKESGSRTVGITRLGKSPLSRYCDVVLHTVANETRFRPEAMSSRVAQLAIIDTLVSCCAIADPDTTIPQLERSARILSEKRY
jgi:RpiR family transcriptional regulator, carbohydrate utilization regulator